MKWSLRDACPSGKAGSPLVPTTPQPVRASRVCTSSFALALGNITDFAVRTTARSCPESNWQDDSKWTGEALEKRLEPVAEVRYC